MNRNKIKYFIQNSTFLYKFLPRERRVLAVTSSLESVSASANTSMEKGAVQSGIEIMTHLCHFLRKAINSKISVKRRFANGKHFFKVKIFASSYRKRGCWWWPRSGRWRWVRSICSAARWRSCSGCSRTQSLRKQLTLTIRFWIIFLDHRLMSAI